jgi:hypothetical protein
VRLKAKFHGFFCFFLISFGAALSAKAQSVTTNQAGSWNDPSTWVGGIVPNAANSSSIGINHDVFIPSGYSVTVDGLALNNQLTINTGGTLNLLTEASPGFTQNNVVGTLIRQNGSTLTGSTGANLVFASGAIYRHQFTTTQGNIPLAVWNANSTLSIEGYTTFTSATPAGNWSQNFGHVIWNCAAQTSAVNLNGLLTAVQGDLTLQSTNIGVLQISTLQNPTISVGGNFSALGTSRFNLSTTGASPGVTLNVAGSFIFNSTNASGSYLGISGISTVNIAGSFSMQASGGLLRMAGAGTTGSGTLNINGNFTLAAGTITEVGSDPSQGNINFTGANTTHTFFSTGTISQRINYGVAAGHSLRVLGESQLVGTTLSTLTVGGTLILKSTNLTGAIMTGAAASTLGNVKVGIRTFNPGSRLVYGGSAQQTIGTGQPTTAGVITEINNASGVVLATAVTMNGDLYITSGNLTVANANLTVGGSTVLNGGNILLISSTAIRTLTLNGPLALNGGGINVASGTVNASLILGSTLSGGGYIYFTGSNTTVTVNGTGALGRSFPISGAISLKTLTVNRPGGTVVFDQNLTTGLLTINDGAVDINAGLTVTSDVNLASGTILFIEEQTVEIGRYFNSTVTGGVLSASGNTTLNVFGTTGTMGTLAFAPGGSTLGDLVVNRTGTGTTIVLNSPLTITRNLTLTDGIIQNTSGLTLASGVNVIRTSNASFQAGSMAPLGGPYNLTLSGANMTTGAEAAGPLNNVISSAGTVTLTTDLTAVGDFTLTSGTFTSGAHNISVRTFTNQATFNMPTTGVLALTGDLINNGTFNRNGTVAFNGVTSISGTTNPSFKNILINGTLTAPAVLPVYGSFTNNGSFVAGSGTVSLLGTAGTPQVINGTATTTFNNVSVANTTANPDVLVETTHNLRGVLTLGTNAVFDADGNAGTGVFTLISSGDNPSQDAAIAAMSGTSSVLGSVTVQRFMSIEGGNNRPAYNNGRIYRYISSPVQNATVQDIQQEIPVTGQFTGVSSCENCNPIIASMFRYDETIVIDTNHDGVNTVQDGYQRYPFTSNQATLESGRGYSIFVRGDIAPVSTVGNARWDVRNPINAGTVVYPATFTSSGNVAVDGWNLVGNPYPSTIDWNAASGWTKTGLDNTIYLTDNGARAGGPEIIATFNGTVGTNGGSRYIAMGQAFFVKSNGGPINFSSTEAVKAPGASTVFFREMSPANVLRVALQQGAFSDEVVIHFREDATPAFDPNVDAYKRMNTSFINLSTLLPDGSRLVINSLPDAFADCGSTIKLDVANTEPGTYALRFSDIESFKSNISISLYDAFLNRHIPVSNQSTYSFEVGDNPASMGEDRFSLLVSSKALPDLSLLTGEPVCPGQEAKIVIPVARKGATYFVQSGTDTLALAFGTGAKLELTVPHDKLKPGENSFLVTVKDAGCPSLFNQIISKITVADITPVAINLVGDDQLASNYGAGNEWYFDGVITGNNKQMIMADRSGTYTLAVYTQGCRMETTRVFIASDRDGYSYSIYPNPVRRSKDVLTIESASQESITIVGTTGKEVGLLTLAKAGETNVGTFDFASLPAGVYFVRLREGNKYKMVKVLIL